ncbi:response regulator transcription factor [Ostreibacterium oceani]|uniref:Response regulator n=1 Tax=Ostreibacterium oceani TaxID=2654998 RepID=A0A6N7ETM3_9GAMM|nr:response regulator transcription factor [Ostreibacterium oceani]MPV85293.1 response regulator [Ostreibacterium oceani]
MKILIIEDDKPVAENLVKGFSEKGFEADVAHDGISGLAQALSHDYHVIIVDRMLPGLDGLTVIRQLRAQQNETPAIMLTALGEVDDKVEGLEAGSDDYLAKPFVFAELLARVKALAKRNLAAQAQETTLIVGPVVIDKITREVTYQGKSIALQPREFDLLVYMASNAGEVITREMLLKNVWGYEFNPQTNIVDVHISRLRNKLDKSTKKPLIKTLRGVGYVFDAA